jgi:hypothetical protein
VKRHPDRGRRLVAAVTALLLALPFGACGDLSRGELRRGVETLAAVAAEGQLVANGVARDATKTTYARVMAKTLGEEAEHEGEKLADAEPEAGRREERDAAVAIAGEISELLSELQTYPSDERHGELVERHLGEAQDRADALAERLEGEAS